MRTTTKEGCKSLASPFDQLLAGVASAWERALLLEATGEFWIRLAEDDADALSSGDVVAPEQLKESFFVKIGERLDLAFPLGSRCGDARLTTVLASDDALDDPPFQPLHALDLEPDVPEVIQGVAHEVVGREPDAERIEHPLHDACGKRRTAHMLEQHQSPAG